jgi:tripartite-type tricarboxylate transporter receptor subunit TctC
MFKAMMAAAAVCVLAMPAAAQDYPTRPIRLVVSFGPGGGADIVGRILGQSLQEKLGQAVVIENKPGAAGTIGVGTVARARPDGYTLLVQSSSYTITPITYPNTPYDTLRDLSGVTPLAVLPQVLVVAPEKGIKTVQELIALAKARPGTLNYGSAGVGTANQLNAERFRIGAGIDAVHVPFKGTPEVMNELLAGRIDYFFCPINVCLPLIEAKRVVALAMGSSRRSAALPELPTTLELGVQDSDYNFWVGMFVPAETPRDIVGRLYRETARALQDPAVKESLAGLGAEQNLMEPKAFDAEIRKEIEANASLVKAAGIPIAQ